MMEFLRRQHDSLVDRRASSSSDHNKKGYKVVVESVLEEKRPLKSHVCYTETAPQGYTFVPVGIPDLTEACKELARKRGLDILIVSAAPTTKARLDTQHISHHIHRIGHHFPNRVVDSVREAMNHSSAQQASMTASIGRRLDAQGRRLGLSDAHATARQRRQQIAGAIRELFPRIPDDDCAAIIDRAFAMGAKTVGNAEDLPLARRVQLAVVAHIRHIHTDYDVLLRTFTWREARQLVEEPCLKVITKWRGETDEHDDDLAELENVFREVIVIDDSDDDDPGAAGARPAQHRRRRSPSLEIVAQRTVPSAAAPAAPTPLGKRRRTSPSTRPRSLSPALARTQQYAPDIISVRPQRGPKRQQILQLDEMSRRAEARPYSPAQYASARPTRPSYSEYQETPALHQPVPQAYAVYGSGPAYLQEPGPVAYAAPAHNFTAPLHHARATMLPSNEVVYHSVEEDARKNEYGRWR